MQNIIVKKKKEFFENKLKESIVGALAENQIVKHDTKSILKTFKSFYSYLAGNLLTKVPKLTCLSY